MLAVADSIVVVARDDFPDNVLGHNDEFRPAVVITPDTVAGNTIVLDLGGGAICSLPAFATRECWRQTRRSRSARANTCADR